MCAQGTRIHTFASTPPYQDIQTHKNIRTKRHTNLTTQRHIYIEVLFLLLVQNRCNKRENCRSHLQVKNSQKVTKILLSFLNPEKKFNQKRQEEQNRKRIIEKDHINRDKDGPNALLVESAFFFH